MKLHFFLRNQASCWEGPGPGPTHPGPEFLPHGLLKFQGISKEAPGGGVGDADPLDGVRGLSVLIFYLTNSLLTNAPPPPLEKKSILRLHRKRNHVSKQTGWDVCSNSTLPWDATAAARGRREALSLHPPHRLWTGCQGVEVLLLVLLRVLIGTQFAPRGHSRGASVRERVAGKAKKTRDRNVLKIHDSEECDKNSFFPLNQHFLMYYLRLHCI